MNKMIDLDAKPFFYARKLGVPIYTSSGEPRDLRKHQLSDVANDTPSRAFCGPTAIAAITGAPIPKIRDTYRLVRHGLDWEQKLDRIPPITTTHWQETREVLERFGFNAEWECIADTPTVAAFVKARPEYSRDYPRVVFVANHVVAISGSQFCDTFSRGKVVDLDDAPGRRRRVKRALLLTRILPPLILVGHRPLRE